MIRRGIVEAFAVSNQHAEQRTQLEQLMPIPVVACKTRRIQAHHQSGFTQAHFCDQRLKAESIATGCAGLAEIVVDHVNPFPWPTKQGRALNQPVLQLRAFLVMADLPRR